MNVEGILLASGSSKRMGTNKLLLPFKGLTVFEYSFNALINCSELNKVIVVVAPDFNFKFGKKSCKVIINESFKDGMGSSIQKGIEASSPDIDGYLIAFADMPNVSSELCTSLIFAFKNSGKQILVPRYNKKNGHPVVFSSQLRNKLLDIKGDIGGRQIINDNPWLVEYFDTNDMAVISDIDTKEDYLEANIN